MADVPQPIDPQDQQFAREVQINDPQIWRQAREVRAAIKAVDKEAETFFNDLKRPHDLAKKAIMDKEKEVRGPLANALAALDDKILTYEERFFGERQVEQEKLQESLGDLAILPDLTDWVEGESRRYYWSAEVTSLVELLQAILDDRVPLAYVQPNMEMLNRMARTLKETMNIPGVAPKRRVGIVQRWSSDDS